MDVVVVSARGAATAPHWSEGDARDFASELARTGHRVRWLRATLRGGPAVAPLPQVRSIDVPGRAVPFGRVQARTEDGELDRVLARSLRADPADWVVHFGHGAPGSANVLWLAARMGASGAALVRAAEVLCHRGNLVHSTGAACAEFSDPERCRRCCSDPFPGGLSPAQATLVRSLSKLGWLAPMPGVVFQNRSDSLVGGLLEARQVVTFSSAEVDLLAAAGVPRRILVEARAGQGATETLLSAVGSAGTGTVNSGRGLLP